MPVLVKKYDKALEKWKTLSVEEKYKLLDYFGFNIAPKNKYVCFWEWYEEQLSKEEEKN